MVFFYDTLTWEQAKAACEAKGGHLVTNYLARGTETD